MIFIYGTELCLAALCLCVTVILVVATVKLLADIIKMGLW